MKGDMYRRLAYAWKRAAKAIAVTSSTTSVAMAANALSPIIPIRAFGIYAGIIVLVNYLMVIMIMPPLQIIYERNFRHRCGCCDSKKDKKQESNVEPGETDIKFVVEDKPPNTTNIDIEMQDNSLPSIIIEEDKKYLRIKETTKEAKDKKPKKEDLEHTKALKLEMKLASIKSKTDYSHLYSSG